ncbi:MAG: hypothetical protein JXR70_09845, partial [Spirochaetales bacterium]|nr:hypothetical protein [Spirochaetales bacterium]
MIIKYNAKTDSLFRYSSTHSAAAFEMVIHPVRKDTLNIYKEIILNNVQFLNEAGEKRAGAGLCLIHFHNKVTIKNTLEMTVDECVFDSLVQNSNDKTLVSPTEIDSSGNYRANVFSSCIFKKGIDCSSLGSDEKAIRAQEAYYHCTFYPVNNYGYHSSFMFTHSEFLTIDNCKFVGKGRVFIFFVDGDFFYLHNNSFPEQTLQIRLYPRGNIGAYTNITGNLFQNTVLADIDINSDKIGFDWNQLHRGIIDNMQYAIMINSMDIDDDNQFDEEFAAQKNMDLYLNKYCIENAADFRSESKLLGQFHRKYINDEDIESANKVYIKLKNLQTSRLAYLYSRNPNFKTFFTWKINQFLKIFSAYGTQPARAIIFSLYVILIFAFIYLFFPNSWDSHGKHRIIHRYTFFMKYLNRRQGIHEVYLEDKQSDLLAYEEFKRFIEGSSKKVPQFFIATALPLYKWALSGTRFTATVLSKVDVLKGTWQDVPPGSRWWKMILVIGAFSIAIVYDLMVKILNALMLSINTFTTLGFGEIPMKG